MWGLGLPGCLHRATDPVPDLTCPGLQQLQPCHWATWRLKPLGGAASHSSDSSRATTWGHCWCSSLSGLPQVVLVNLTA